MWMRKREDFYFLFGTNRLRLKCSFAVDGVNVYIYTEIEDIIKMIYVNSFSFLIWSYWNGMIVEVKKRGSHLKTSMGNWTMRNDVVMNHSKSPASMIHCVSVILVIRYAVRLRVFLMILVCAPLNQFNGKAEKMRWNARRMSHGRQNCL